MKSEVENMPLPVPILNWNEAFPVEKIDQDTYAYSYHSKGQRSLQLTVSKSYIYFFFSGTQMFNIQLIDPQHVVESGVGDLTYFAYPYDDGEILVSSDALHIQILAISIKKLHGFFGSDFGDKETVNEFLKSFRMKQYFTVKTVSSEVAVAFHQMFYNPISGAHEKLYLQGKVIEILSHYLNKPKERTELEKQCPFVADHLEMEKIKEAKELIIEHVTNPLTLKDLARAVGTNEFKLKVGFKSMFGTTVYAYLTDYRMQTARKLLSDKQLNVKDVAQKMGYSNPSHFIAAYKKRFGITPKRQTKNY